MSDATRRMLRTVVQLLVGLAAGMPLLVHASGVSESAPGVGVVLGVSAAVTRLMAAPVVQPLLPAWLRTTGGGAAGGR
ncbi:hypothetical protein ACL02U_29920 [Streptomyces sp. MS06]|uniref:hypothetical protein n=1 Tax=Streptomyces sp. MS06 TaxID=3385974 RepID=UPI0039A2A328